MQIFPNHCQKIPSSTGICKMSSSENCEIFLCSILLQKISVWFLIHLKAKIGAGNDRNKKNAICRGFKILWKMSRKGGDHPIPKENQRR